MKKEKSNSSNIEIKDILNKIMIALYIIAVLFFVNTVINIISVNNQLSSSTPVDKYGEEGDELPEYDVSKFSEVDYDGLKKLMKNDGTHVVYIGRESCGYCAMFIPIMQKVQEDYGFTTYYFDVTNVYNYSNNKVVDETAYNELVNYNDFFAENFLATPMVVIFKDGKYVGGTMGYQEESTYSAFLEDNGISKK